MGDLTKNLEEAYADIDQLVEQRDDAYQDLNAAQEQLAKFQWQPIETAPRDARAELGNHILLWPGVIDQTEPVIGTLHGDGKWRDPSGDWEIHPTHWMPLPAPPG